jgi:hypothetical protein
MSKDTEEIIAYADIGSHNKIFEFVGGLVGNRYPHLMHIYSKEVVPDLVKIKITYPKAIVPEFKEIIIDK